MARDIFDEISEESSGGGDIFDEVAFSMQKRPAEEFGRGRATRQEFGTGQTSPGIPRQVGAGALEALGSIGNILDLFHIPRGSPLSSGIRKFSEHREAQGKDALPALLRLVGKVPTGSELTEAFGIEEPETRGEQYARRISRGGVSALPFGPLAALVGAAGGALGQGVEEGFDSPGAGLTAELLTNILAPALGAQSAGKIPGQVAQQARNFGLTESEIAPLTARRGQIPAVKLAGLRGRTSKILGRTEEGIDRAYSALTEQASKGAPLTSEATTKISQELNAFERKLTSGGYTDEASKSIAGAAQKISKDIADGEVTAESLIRSYRNLNKDFGSSKGQTANQLGELKGIISQSIDSISPELGTTFRDLNAVDSNFRAVEKAVGAHNYSPLVDHAVVGGILHAATHGNLVKTLPLFAGVTVGRDVMTRYLLSPRGQGLLRRAGKAAAKGSAPQLAKIEAQMQKDLKDRVDRTS